MWGYNWTILTLGSETIQSFLFRIRFIGCNAASYIRLHVLFIDIGMSLPESRSVARYLSQYLHANTLSDLSQLDGPLIYAGEVLQVLPHPVNDANLVSITTGLRDDVSIVTVVVVVWCMRHCHCGRKLNYDILGFFQKEIFVQLGILDNLESPIHE